jgi:integrase
MADNPMIISRFYFLKNKCAKSAPMKNYRNIQLVKAKRWYVEYYHKVPEGVRHLHQDKEWKRFRVYEDINRFKGDDRVEYGQLLLKAVKDQLQAGYNPFEPEQRLFIEKKGLDSNITDAIGQWKAHVQTSGNEPKTIYRYLRITDIFLEYLIEAGLSTLRPNDISEDVVEQYLMHKVKKHGWSNRNYNNHLSYLSTMFTWFVRKKIVTANPCADIPKKKFTAHVHRYYNDGTLKSVTAWMKEHDPYLYVIAQFIYYAGVRSAKEITQLQVGDILLDRDRIRFRGAATKGNRADYIVLDKKLKDIILASGLMNYPASYYMFTYHGKPHQTPSKLEWLRKRFAKLRKAIKLEPDYTLYSMKHTRAVHLLLDGAQPVDIMQLFRHRDLTATTKYIRDLGFDLNAKFSDKSRDI